MVKSVFILAMGLIIPGAFSLAGPSVSATPAKERPGRYSIPLNFLPANVGVEQTRYEVTWDVTQTNRLHMGALTIDSQSLLLAFYPSNGAQHPLRKFSIQDSQKDTLIASWPTGIFSSGRMELISQDGSVLWSDDFSYEDIRAWHQKLNDLGAKVKDDKVLSASEMTFHSLKSETLKGLHAPFRFCLSQTQGREYTRLCSTPYAIKTTNNEMSLAQVKESKEARVFIQQEQVAAKGSRPVNPGEIIQFFAETTGGVGFEFLSEVPTPHFQDISVAPNQQVLLKGFEPLPLGAKPLGSAAGVNYLEHQTAWQATMGDLRQRWELSLPEDKAILMRGKAGGVFRLTLDFKDLPKDEDRVWLSDRDNLSTYSDTRLLHLYQAEGQKIEDTQTHLLESDKNNPEEILWKFATPNVATYNIDSLTTTRGSHSYKASLEVFRGSSSEFSTRLTAVTGGTSGSVILGELSYNKWFQSLFGMDNDRLSTLRWGFSARYFKSLTQIETSTDKTKSNLSDINIMSAAVRYRFNQGLWGRDETWGLLSEYQVFEMGAAKAPLMGYGVFWGRSMPKVFDDLMNTVPYLRYPKYVDMDLIYSPLSMDSAVKLDQVYSANFHGKIFWSESYFGEVGFAFKKYSFTQSELNYAYHLNLFSVTAGLGLNF